MNTKKLGIIMKVCISLSLSLFILLSCNKNEVKIINTTKSDLLNVRIEIEKTSEILFEVSKVERLKSVSFQINNSLLKSSEGRFILYYSDKTKQNYRRPFGYYTFGTLDCISQILTVKNEHVKETCQ